ncbi:MAG: excinuclease ABC subunit UvrC [Candidatus Margulisiibacteriota bacterium]
MIFPDLPGVYLFKDKNGKVIYVGKAKSLRRRVASYFKTPVDSPKTAALLDHYQRIDFIVAKTELEALLLESRLIKKFLPRYNIQWRDDKQYPYIKLTLQEEWPRLEVSRKKTKDGARYFGPYEAGSVKDTVRLLKKFFPIRLCKESPLKHREQPCLYYYIKQCWAPCAREVSPEEYQKICQVIVKLLEGDLEGALTNLKEEMELASRAQNFERAARLRDRIRNLSRLTLRTPGWKPPRRQQTGATSLWELRQSLGLNRTPRRIEAYDVSNIQGSDIVASMVTFEDGEARKGSYRKFRIRGLDKPNDVAALEQAVFRRYTGSLKAMPRPDLILIDGGIAQARAGEKALKRANLRIPVLGLAKREEELYFPRKNIPLKLPRDSAALLLLQKIRDEAHRFALAFQRASRRLVK